MAEAELRLLLSLLAKEMHQESGPCSDHGDAAEAVLLATWFPP